MGPNTQIPGTIASGPTPPPKKSGFFGRKPSRTGSNRPAAANTIPAAPAAPAPSTGNIVLAPSAPEKKKPNIALIAIIAISVLVVIGIVVAIILANSGSKSTNSGASKPGTVSVQTVKEKFTPYYDYLVFGPTKPDNATVPANTNEWYFAKILSSGTYSSSQLADYADKLTDKFIEFYNSAAGIKSNELSEIDISAYKDIFYAATEYLSVDSQDKNSVKDQLFTQEYNTPSVRTVFDYAKQYLESGTEDLVAYKNFINMHNMIKSFLTSTTTKIATALGGNND